MSQIGGMLAVFSGVCPSADILQEQQQQQCKQQKAASIAYFTSKRHWNSIQSYVGMIRRLTLLVTKASHVT